MGILNKTISWYLKQRIAQINQTLNNPVAVQQATCKDLINTAKNTQWGKQHNYASIQTIADFRKAVPVQDYDNIKPWIEEMMAGEQNLLWPSNISWFAKSSGTTSDKSKFIPVSTESLRHCHLRGGRDALSLFYQKYPSANLFSGKTLIMGGSHEVSLLDNNIRYGDISAVMMQNMPFVAHLLKTPRLSIALMDDWEKKLEKMADAVVRENVTQMAGVPTWTLVLIKRILEKTGKQNLLEVWPNLQLYIHGGVSFTPYRKQFEDLLPGRQMHYLETYNASEGFFGVQDLAGEDMLLMMNHGVFYEFIPFEELGKENPAALSLEEVETGKNYTLIISTNAGLWRYMIGDTIQFTSTFPFKFKITGRTKHFINAFGEEVIIDNADQAVKVACEKTNSTVLDYTVGPIYIARESKGGHEWLIEFEKEPDNMQQFTEILDQALQSVNSDYEAKRTADIALQPPVVHNIPKDTFYNWLKSKGKLGGQNKVPRLSNDRTYVDEILTFLKELRT